MVPKAEADPSASTVGAKHLSMNLTRSKFEQLTDPLLNRTKQPCKDCLKDAGLKQSEISEVLLVGGMTRMPKVREQGKEADVNEDFKNERKQGNGNQAELDMLAHRMDLVLTQLH